LSLHAHTIGYVANPAPQHRIEPDGLPDVSARMLFEAWVLKLSEERLGFTQRSSGGSSEGHTATFGDILNDHFILHGSGLDIERVTSTGVSEDVIQTIIEDSLTRVAAGDMGESVVYQVEMTLKPLDFMSEAIHLMRTLGDQVHIEGSRRLSDAVLLDFEQGLLADAPSEGLLFAPPSKIRATIFVPGPGPSEWSQKNAAGAAEMVAAVCAFATGRAVDYYVPMFPAQAADAETAIARRHDLAIPGLARDYISLDVFGDLPALGDVDAVLRVRGAMLAYHAALKQTSPDVAVMLLVTSIEALISPRHEWGKQKVTTRFRKSLVELCRQAVDALLAHDNVEQAFDYKKKGAANRQQRELLERIYDTRSIPTHTGLGLSATGMAILAAPDSMRVALLSDLARAAILSYIQSPRSSLIGHPTIDPPNPVPASPTGDPAEG
jgi:hypothetical protein